eukprot:SAG31_NODE_13801_length_846_cov_0.934404_1_plen_87_part_10
MLARIKLGMFDPPTLSSYNNLGKPELQTNASTATNREAAAKGMVLLKNDLVGGPRNNAAQQGKEDENSKRLLPLDAKDYIGSTGAVL